VDNILTYCYHYDPKTNKHSLIVARVVQLGGLVTVFTLGGFMIAMFRRDARHGDGPTDTGTGKTGSTRTGTKVNG
jgi:protein SCO1/2